jgi:hypothetical protein
MAFASIFLRQKSTNLKCKYKKAELETLEQKAARKNVAEIETRLT